VTGITDFIALDVETANANFASICSIGLVHFRAGQVFKSLTILIDPEDHFDPINVSIHGIRPEDIAGKPTMAKAFPIIGAALKDAAIVHHSPFDRTGHCVGDIVVSARAMVESRRSAARFDKDLILGLFATGPHGRFYKDHLAKDK
jgi:hypothetical protein